MTFKELKTGNITFNILKWNLPRVLEKQGKITGIIAEPMSILMAGSSEVSEEAIMGALMESVLGKIAELDLVSFSGDLLWGCQFKTVEGIWKECSLAELENAGADISTILTACAAVIMVNYGAVLKNDLGESLAALRNL